MEKSLWHALIKRPAIIFLFIPLLMHAPAFAEMPGGVSGGYLRNPVGAKSASLGGAFSASPDYLAAWWNPAALPAMHNKALMLGGAYRSFGRTDALISYKFPIPPRVSMEVSALYRGDPFLDDLRDKEGEKLEEAKFSTISIKIGVGYLLRRNLTLGAAIGIYYQRLPDYYDERTLDMEYSSATAIGGLDVGLRYAFRPHLSFGAILKNINAKFNWQFNSGDGLEETFEESFPVTFVLGSQYTGSLLGYPLVWNSDLNIHPFENGFELASHPTVVWDNGAEWQRWEAFFIRLGLGDIAVSSALYRQSDLYWDTFSPAITAGFFLDLSAHLKNTSLNYAITTDKVWAGVEQQLDFVVSF
ncbi:MAG: hypothetical protein ACLFSB_11895 [Chitinispirillaceae bacterium]